MTTGGVALGIFTLVVGYAIGKAHGAAIAYGEWRKSKVTGPKGCVHNIVSEREYPFGDRIVCEDCGESDPAFAPRGDA